MLVSGSDEAMAVKNTPQWQLPTKNKEVKVGEEEEEAVERKWESVIDGHDPFVLQVSPKLTKIHFNGMFLKNSIFKFCFCFILFYFPVA